MATRNTVIVAGDDAENVTVQSTGAPGPQGPPGAAGGEPGSHVQAGAASEFTVTHNLGRVPASVWMVGADGSVLLVRFDTFTNTTFRVVANFPITGTVYYS